MQISRNMRKKFRRRFIGVARHGLICSLGVALLSESVIAIPSTTGMQIAQQPVNTEQKATRAEAEKALGEGDRLYQQGDKASLQQAIVEWKVALKLWQQVGDRSFEAITLIGIGKIYSDLGDQKESLTFYKQALPILRAVGDRRFEAITLIGIGKVYSDLGDQKEALTLYKQALLISRAVSNRHGEASALTSIGKVYSDLGDKQQALTFYNQALPLFRAVSDRWGEASTLTGIGKVYSDLGDKQQALTFYNQALSLFRAVRDRHGEAYALTGIGHVYSNLGDKQQALTFYNQALSLFRAVNNRHGEASALTSIGHVYSDLGDKEQALTFCNQALLLFRAVKDRGGEASTFNSIGNAHSNSGNKEQALTSYNQALPLFRAVSDRWGEAITLNSIGRVYSDLGDQKEALTLYKQALLLFRGISNRGGEASTLTGIGKVHSDLGDKQQALKFYNQALPLFRAVKDRWGEAITFNSIGRVYSDLGDKQQALTSYNQALPLFRAVSNRWGEASTLTGIGNAHSNLGDKEQALKFYNQALPLFRDVRDRHGEAYALTYIGIVYSDLGNKEVALKKFDAAIEIVKDLRSKIVSPEFRTAYFATVQYIYKSKIDVLMELHKQNPSNKYDIQAVETTERSRARSLVELLTEAKADIRAGINPELSNRERNLNQTRDLLEKQRQELASRPNVDQQAISEIDQKIAKSIEEQQQLRTEIRQASPSYAALKYPEPISLPQIQQQVLDDDTVLLTYSLGSERSYLWLVSKTEVQSYELPKGSTIEAQAKQFYDQQKTNPSKADRNKQVGLKLSQMLLQPVANKLGNKRLLIVGDGILEYIPFAALPGCKDGTCNDSLPLVSQHEIVHAPSVSTLAILRNEQRRKPTKTLAIIADPVFDTKDERFKVIAIRDKLPLETALNRAANDDKFKRLLGTRKEAEDIMKLVPSADRTVQFDFDANREFATSSELGKYRYILFATHGIFDSERPELSGVVLAGVDKKGQSQNGFLRLNDIFNLNLSADLVVLSACETGLGKQIGGEGLVGLTRGFMYAGSPRVVVSLWQVSDESTAVLMTKFYTKILQEKLTPAAALRSAQLEMSQDKKYADPYYWAGFTLQGEWR
jgi:CHAT domain-containing protein/Flp pilus assembly protein TadD